MSVLVSHSGAVACLGCGYALPLPEVASAAGTRCPRCRARQSGRLFRAAFYPPQDPPTEPASPGEAVCFQHATKRAAVACDHCGRFLCPLCDLTFGQTHSCPDCVVAARRAEDERWIARRLNLDTIALATAILPVLLIWPSLIGGPASIYLGIRALRQPPGPLPRSRVRAYLALAIGAFVVVGWLVLLITAFGTLLYRGGTRG